MLGKLDKNAYIMKFITVADLQLFQKIFPLAKVSFAKGKMFGAGRHPTGPEWGE